jgi:hypothetical protein
VQSASQAEIEIGPVNEDDGVWLALKRGTFQFKIGVPEFRQGARNLDEADNRQLIRAGD